MDGWRGVSRSEIFFSGGRSTSSEDTKTPERHWDGDGGKAQGQVTTVLSTAAVVSDGSHLQGLPPAEAGSCPSSEADHQGWSRPGAVTASFCTVNVTAVCTVFPAASETTALQVWEPSPTVAESHAKLPTGGEKTSTSAPSR